METWMITRVTELSGAEWGDSPGKRERWRFCR